MKEEKKVNFRWTKEMSRELLGFLVEEVRKGNKPNNTFRTSSFVAAAKVVSDKFQVHCTANNVEHHMKTIRNSWAIISTVRNNSRFGWNDNLKMITASPKAHAAYVKACIEVRFFYIVNHGVDKALFERLFEESKKFFSLPEEEKMKLERKKEFSGYTALYSEKLDTSLHTKGDPKESFYIGPLHDEIYTLNRWPSEEFVPNWRPTVEAYHRQALSAGKSLLSLLALALNLDENFFENVGALDPPMPFLRLLHYPEGDPSCHNDEVLGASAHSDYGMITLLATDGVPGLQVCREKDRQPQIWENVPHVEGAIIVNIGDMTERWTNGLFRSTLHRVLPKGRERYSAALFINPRHDFFVECLETCCSELNPPRFSPIRFADYLQERYRAISLTYGA